MNKGKTALKLILTMTISFPVGFAAGFCGLKAINDAITSSKVEDDKQKYGAMYDLMLTNKSGRVISLPKSEKPITIQLAENFSDSEKSQLISAINALDDISPNLNYKLLDSSNYTVSANITVAKGDLLKQSALAQTNFKYDNNAQITYPISIEFKKSFSDYYADTASATDNLLCRVMKHEMMHTLGFADLYDEKHFDKSIMWYSINNADVVDDFSERDKACINKLYDDESILIEYPQAMYFTANNSNLYTANQQTDDLDETKTF